MSETRRADWRDIEVGQVWRSRDKRDKGRTVRVEAWDGVPHGFVTVRSVRKSHIRARNFVRLYDLVTGGEFRVGRHGHDCSLRGCTCSVGYCQKPASLDIRTLPLCYEHGYEVARAYELRITAERRLREEASQFRRFEVFQAERGNREGAVVYYARIGDYIKIGYSTRLRNRLSSLRVDELLACEPGSPELERERHREFTEERIDLRRENFRPSERLNAHIEALRDEHGLPHWATRPRTSKITTRRIGDPK